MRRGDSVQNAAMSTQEDAPEDQQGDDTGAGDPDATGDEAAAEEPKTDEPKAEEPAAEEPKPDDDPLERITERIDKARAQAEDAGVIDDTEEEYFAESGATEVEDDQTIAPPG